MPSTVLVTGANRGIGLEFVRQYSAAGWRVHAACRHPEKATQLNVLAGENTHIHSLDVAEVDQIAALAEKLQGEALDLLINNAGVYGPSAQAFGQLHPEPWLETFRVNSIAPLLMAQAFIEHLRAGQGRVIANLGSKMGSIADNHSGSSYIYRSSKAALNAALKSLSLDLRSEFKVLILHPGWVRTDMGGANAQIEVTESVRCMREHIAHAKAEDNGRFIDIDGSTIPW